MGERRNNMHEWAIEIEEKMSRMEPLPTKDEEELADRNQQRRRLYKIYGSATSRYTDELERLPLRLFVPRSREAESVFKITKLRRQYSILEESSLVLKEDSLLHFLRRSGKPFESYLAALSEGIDELRDAYDGLGYGSGDDTEAFLRMMLLSGSFLLEVIRTKRDRRSRSPHADASVNPVIWRLLEDHEEMKNYQRDILFVGNQVPMVLLERLLMVAEGDTRVINDKDRRVAFLKDIVATFVPVSRVPRIEHMYNDFKSSLHILDVHRRSLVHRDFKRGKTPKRRKSLPEFYSMNIPSATELHKVGIGFTISASTSMLDVSLHGKTLILPEIVVDDSTLPSFSNLITFEQLYKDVAKNEIASYMYFMGCLVLVASDASLLQSCGIIITTWPPDRVADFFNEMTRQYCNVPSDSVAPEIIEAFTMVRARYNKMATEWRKDLFQTYLKSPWAIMSVIAAILLFTLSFIQTVYTVLGYVRPK